jgi:hypothetical protein
VNTAAINPPAFTCWTPARPRQVNNTFCSSHVNVCLTAAWWASSTCPATSRSATAHKVETDFTGVKVRSYPRPPPWSAAGPPEPGNRRVRGHRAGARRAVVTALVVDVVVGIHQQPAKGRLVLLIAERLHDLSYGAGLRVGAAWRRNNTASGREACVSGFNGATA